MFGDSGTLTRKVSLVGRLAVDGIGMGKAGANEREREVIAGREQSPVAIFLAISFTGPAAVLCFVRCIVSEAEQIAWIIVTPFMHGAISLERVEAGDAHAAV